MALNIKNPQVEQLAEEIAGMTGESKTEAIRQALLDRRDRLRYRFASVDRAEQIQSFLEREVWSRVPKHMLGKKVTKAEREEILGYGPEGV
jgi:antitoxin VapB